MDANLKRELDEHLAKLDPAPGPQGNRDAHYQQKKRRLIAQLNALHEQVRKGALAGEFPIAITIEYNGNPDIPTLIEAYNASAVANGWIIGARKSGPAVGLAGYGMIAADKAYFENDKDE